MSTQSLYTNNQQGELQSDFYHSPTVRTSPSTGSSTLQNYSLGLYSTDVPVSYSRSFAGRRTYNNGNYLNPSSGKNRYPSNLSGQAYEELYAPYCDDYGFQLYSQQYTEHDYDDGKFSGTFPLSNPTTYQLSQSQKYEVKSNLYEESHLGYSAPLFVPRGNYNYNYGQYGNYSGNSSLNQRYYGTMNMNNQYKDYSSSLSYSPNPLHFQDSNGNINKVTQSHSRVNSFESSTTSGSSHNDSITNNEEKSCLPETPSDCISKELTHSSSGDLSSYYRMSQNSLSSIRKKSQDFNGMEGFNSPMNGDRAYRRHSSIAQSPRDDETVYIEGYSNDQLSKNYLRKSMDSVSCSPTSGNNSGKDKSVQCSPPRNINNVNNEEKKKEYSYVILESNNDSMHMRIESNSSETDDNENIINESFKMITLTEEEKQKIEINNSKSNTNSIIAKKNSNITKNSKRKNSSMKYLRVIEEQYETEKDTRTTFMICNIPNSFTQETILRILNNYVKNRYDFFYLPIDFRTQCNLGYAYINLIDRDTALLLVHSFDNKRWPNTPSQKTCEICFARIQGQAHMIQHSKDWAVMHLPEQYRPLFYVPLKEVRNGKEVTIMKRMYPDVEMKMK
ncbi:hypothetical protein WA158_000075 [Blastocystis sp. Blastoise]